MGPVSENVLVLPDPKDPKLLPLLNAPLPWLFPNLFWSELLLLLLLLLLLVLLLLLLLLLPPPNPHHPNPPLLAVEPLDPDEELEEELEGELEEELEEPLLDVEDSLFWLELLEPRLEPDELLEEPKKEFEEPLEFDVVLDKLEELEEPRPELLEEPKLEDPRLELDDPRLELDDPKLELPPVAPLDPNLF